jgi:hypothetical protein
MRLLVFWGSKEEADFQTPKEVKWEDGSPATLEDYYRNQLATQSAHPTEKGLATVLCPDVVAITRFDVAKGHWVLYTDRGSMDLDETDRVSICNKMLTAGCDAAIVYAARKTKRIVTQANRKNLTPAQLAEWNDAVDEYRSMKGPAQ